MDSNGWKLLKYDTGDFFCQHVDLIGSHTILLFPSNKINKNLLGGELIINNQLYEPNSFTKNTIIIFPVNSTHEVKKIIRGTRFVFKISASFNHNNNNNNLLVSKKNYSEQISDVGCNYSKLNTLKNNTITLNEISDIELDIYDMFCKNSSDY